MMAYILSLVLLPVGFILYEVSRGFLGWWWPSVLCLAALAVKLIQAFALPLKDGPWKSSSATFWLDKCCIDVGDLLVLPVLLGSCMFLARLPSFIRAVPHPPHTPLLQQTSDETRFLIRSFSTSNGSAVVQDACF